MDGWRYGTGYGMEEPGCLVRNQAQDEGQDHKLVFMDNRRAAKLLQWAIDYGFAANGQIAALTSRVSRARPGAHALGEQGKPLIVLIPGIYESWRFMLPVARELHRQGYPVLLVPELGDNRRPVGHGAEVLAKVLAALADRAVAESRIVQVVLVAHSKGGLIGKQVLLDRFDGLDGLDGSDQSADPHAEAVEVLGLVAVATPFRGSRYAARARGQALREFSPESETIRQLSAREEVNPRIVSVLPSFDPHIPGDRTLPGASERILTGAGHFRVLRSREGIEAIVSGINSLHER